MNQVAAVIPCYRRFGYLGKCLDHLSQAGVDILLFPDLDDEENNAELDKFAKHFKAKVVSRSERRMYAASNRVRAFIESMDLGYEFLLNIDSDVVVSPHYITLLMAAYNWCEGTHLVGSGVSCMLTPIEKKILSGALSHAYDNGNNLLSHKSMWASMRPTLEFCNEMFYVQSPADRDNKSIREWFAEQMAPRQKHYEYMYGRVMRGLGGTGADGLMQVACAVAGFRVCFTRVNRCINIGREGENTDDPRFSSIENVQLDVLDHDAMRKDFYWID